MKVAVVTVDYNNHKDTYDFLQSAQKLDTRGLEVLWLVVDNGSDISVKKTVDKYINAVWLQTGKNLGFTGGFNRGIRYAKQWGADYILIVNNDTVFGDSQIIKKLLNVKADVVSPKIYFAPRFEFFKERYKKEDEGKVIWYAGGNYDWLNIAAVHRGIDEVDTGKYDKVEKTDFVSGCCLLIRQEVLEKVGYFEEKLFAYYEDTDWIERVRQAGYQQYYAGNTFIYHKVSRTAGIGSAFTDRLTTRNRLWLGFKYASLRTKLALLRQSVRLALIGRPAQKMGVWDYFTNNWKYPDNLPVSSPEFPIELSIVIINYKTTNLVLQLLDSVFKQSYKNFEVIVLDNSPEESCKQNVLKKYPKIKFIENRINNGFSAGNNQMIDYSLGKYVLLLNSDIKVKTDSIKNLMKAVNSDRAIYAGKLLFPDGTEQDSVFRLPTAWGAFLQYFLNKPGSYFMYRPKKFEQVEGAVMACFLIPQRVILEIGKLNEATFMYFEDIEYCRRAKSAGIPIYYVPQAEFIHYHGQSSKKAGNETSNARLVQAAKWYHGRWNYFWLTAVLWAGQKWGRAITPVSRWKEEK